VSAAQLGRGFFSQEAFVKRTKRRAKGRYFSVVIERDADGYYVGSVPELHGCHSQAKSLDELMQRIREAIELCLEVQQTTDDGGEFIGVQRISV
jgi:predicted RNase H-like HicB family nuclease